MDCVNGFLQTTTLANLFQAEMFFGVFLFVWLVGISVEWVARLCVSVLCVLCSTSAYVAEWVCVCVCILVVSFCLVPESRCKRFSEITARPFIRLSLRNINYQFTRIGFVSRVPLRIRMISFITTHTHSQTRRTQTHTHTPIQCVRRAYASNINWIYRNISIGEATKPTIPRTKT